MASKPLNVNAPEFIPSSKRMSDSHFYFPDAWNYCNTDPALEESITSEELEELEACEEWVQTMAELEELEREHLIATALSEAEPSQILEVEMRALSLDASGKRKPEANRRGGKQ